LHLAANLPASAIPCNDYWREYINAKSFRTATAGSVAVSGVHWCTFALLVQPMHRYFAINKPYGMLSQFIGGHPGHPMLGDLDFTFPEGIHALGRLDHTSEGLLLLTTNKSMTKILFNPEAAHTRTYLVNVYRPVSEETLLQLATGVSIRIEGGGYYTTAPASVQRVERPGGLQRNTHEIREDLPQDWLTITLTEGKFRQVRKMLQAVYHPCHRLIRLSIGGMNLGDLPSGGVRELSEQDFFRELGITQRSIPIK
jgi:23S rRNA pseudouridine2457 synthase